jgi:hypothetical protein
MPPIYRIAGNLLLPLPLSDKYDPSGPYNNPGGTMPAPAGSSIPASVWNGSRNTLVWTTIADVSNPVQYTTTWTTPVFDMRPDLGSVSDNRTDKTGSKPIWNPAAQVWVQLVVTDDVVGSSRYYGLEILAQEWGHVLDLAQIAAITDFQNVTAQFTNTFVDSNGNSNSVVGWYPVGDGNPMRYYQLKLTFNLLRQYSPTPPMIYVQGAAY